MKLVRKIFYKIKEKISSFNRGPKKHIFTEPFSIISCNCIAGLIYHDYNLMFMSPTINLFIESPDFVKFVLNLSYYVNCDLVEISNSKYPIGKLDDIKIHFLHYKNFDEAKEKWDIRKKRIIYDNIYVIMSDRDNFEEKLLMDFEKIKYKKVLFSHNNIENDNVVYVSKDAKKSMVDDLTKYYNFKGEKIYEHYFDFEKWLTGNYTTKECKKND